MKDTQFYQQILGLELPWTVEEVKLSVDNKRVDIWVNHPSNHSFSCSKCSEHFSVYDHVAERSWRHLNTCQFETYIHAKIPRTKCTEHGVLQTNVPWASKQSGFTLLMEHFILELLQQCQHVQGVCRLLDLGWHQVFRVMKKAVKRGLLKREKQDLKHIAIDEKAFKKGHNYRTIIYNDEKGSVHHIEESRKIESLNRFYETLTNDEKKTIKTVTMDMWPAYISSTKLHVPDAESKIVFDRFHIMKDVNEAVNKTRRTECKNLIKQDDTSLVKTKYLWAYAEENLPEKYVSRLSELRESDLFTAKAWAMKENLRYLWSMRDKSIAERDLRAWVGWVKESGISAMIAVAEKIERHAENILTYCDHQVTNAIAEGLNSKIMAVKRRVGGFRNIENFKTAIYFYCGKLDFYP